MTEATKRPPRGQSANAKQAKAYLAKHPDTTANELAAKFQIDPSTVRRSPWWKQRGQGTQEGAK